VCRETFRIIPVAESVTIRAVPPPQISGLSWASPCLLVEGTAHDAERHPLWYQRLFYAGDCFELTSISNPSDSYPETRLSFTGLPPKQPSISPS
jgi:hypothetical protein